MSIRTLSVTYNPETKTVLIEHIANNSGVGVGGGYDVSCIALSPRLQYLLLFKMFYFKAPPDFKFSLMDPSELLL